MIYRRTATCRNNKVATGLTALMARVSGELVAMKISCNRRHSDVAWDLAVREEIPYGMYEGYAVLRPSDAAGFLEAWDAAGPLPFGRKAWERLRKEFRRNVGTDEKSVHHGSNLPADGIAVLDCGEFSVVLHQVVTDLGWWDWIWAPRAIVASPN